MDLSKTGGAQGSYACECDVGYELVEAEAGKPHCSRTVCGAIESNIAHTIVNSAGVVRFDTFPWINGPYDPECEGMDCSWTSELSCPGQPGGIVGEKGDDGSREYSCCCAKEGWKSLPSMDSFTGTPVLRSFDQAEFQCAEGYSTDGRTNPESMFYTVTCMGSGLFDRPLAGGECQPVRCDNFALPSVPRAVVLSDAEHFFEYGDEVQFKCFNGYTIGGAVGAETHFKIPCRSDGKFPDIPSACVPVQCPVPVVQHATSSGVGDVVFDNVVTYSCIDGYEVATSGGGHTFSGKCGEDGILHFDAGEQLSCAPVLCGELPSHPNAALLIPSAGGALVPLPVGEHVTFATPPLTIQCNSGYTLGGIAGGLSELDLECSSSGEFSHTRARLGHEDECQRPTYPVRGEVTDAQSAWTKLQGVEVVFEIDNVMVATATTNSQGQYSVRLPLGHVHTKATKDGYITSQSDFVVAGPISVRQGADLSLSKVLPAGQWRVVLSWDHHSRDLDSHTYFGRSERSHSWYARTRAMDYSSGLEVDLDRDDVNGYGPETTTFKNVGQCQAGTGCLIYFKVHNYLRNRDGTMGASKGIVTVYRGHSVAATYKIPESVGPSIWHDVFTLDATYGVEKLYPGRMEPPPALVSSAADQKDWRSSFDWGYWSRVPGNALVYGITTSDQDALHNIEFGKYYTVQNAGNFECSEVALDLSHEGWGECPSGSFIQGLHREGSKYESVTGVFQIDQARCCRPKALPAQFGECVTIPAWGSCPSTAAGENTALVGLHRSGVVVWTPAPSGGYQPRLHEPAALVDEFKCCAFASAQ
jgi:hypothetical protein